MTYVNLKNRLNYGSQIGHIPFLFRTASAFRDNAGNLIVIEEEERIFQDRLSLLAAYPLRTTRRFEAQTGITRYGFDTTRRVFQCTTGCRRVNTSSPATRDPIYLSQSSAAYVVDFSNFGFTSPVQGGRYRLQVGATFGSTNYGTVLGDVRRYVRTGLVTFAGRAVHIGNYGAEEGDLFSDEYLGYSFTPTYVRGYSFFSFDPEECPSTTPSCAVLDRLIGTRVAAASLEIRVPLLGTEQYGLFTFPYLPTELSVFTDAGLAWTDNEDFFDLLVWERDSSDRIPVVSAGISARMNLFGSAVLELFYAKPFQRPDKGAFLGANLIPGW